MATAPISLAVVTGGHAFDVPGLQMLFRAMPGVDCYPQSLEDWAADWGNMRQRYDVMLFYNYHQDIAALDGARWGCQVRSAVEGLGQTGQGIVILHHGLVAFQGWDAWSALVGVADRRFENFKGQRVPVHVAEPAHPITEGLADWELADETYTLAGTPGGATVLLTTDHPRSSHALAWVRRHGAARIFCYQSGHDRRTYKDPGFRAILERGIRWAAAGRSAA